jgi:Stage II sporulation protein E (SpoIIE)
MNELYSKIVRWLSFTRSASWKILHDRRRMTPSDLNSRNTLTLAFGGTLLVLLLAALSLKAVGVKDWRHLVANRPDFHLLDENQYQLTGVMPQKHFCDRNCGILGVPELLGEQKKITTPADLDDLSIARGVGLTSVNEKYWSSLTYSIDSSAFVPLVTNRKSVVVSLHRINYAYASINVNGVPWGVFSGGPLRLTLPIEMVTSGPVVIEVKYIVSATGAQYLNRRTNIPPFICSESDLRLLMTFESDSSASNGAIVGMMSRILIAVFALMLFLFLDSAPETLGLGLFLGFEAIAMGLGANWMSLHWNNFVIHYCYQMGDIFRLYFFLQLARIIKPSATKWLLYGSLLSIPYGIAKQMEATWGIDGLALIPRLRDSFAGTVGALACLKTLWAIRNLKIPWRQFALILGALGSAQQVLGPLTHYFPHINGSTTFTGFYIVYESLSVYILALATFTNISTLENRVRRMSAAKVRSDLIEQEMELGRSVQKAFLNIPKMPPDFEVVSTHEAAVYVSGDLYYVQWDEVEQRLVVLLSDVTGHGVQASLKAVACFMVARNLWHSQHTANRSLFEPVMKSKFESFHRQASELLSSFSAMPDVLAFGGIEFYPRQRRAFLYRSNFHTPLLVEPDGTGGWSIVVPALKVGKATPYRIKPGTALAFFSDGFIDGSRQYSRLIKFISKELPSFDGKASSLKELFAAFNTQNLDRPNDDRTLVVVSWRREEYLRSLKKSA